MLLRLLLALILAAFALPAAAMPCHDAPAAMAGMQHHAPAQPDKAMPAHACIGCVPPSSWRASVMPAAVRVPSAVRVVPVAALAVGKASAPATPPPKPEV